MAERDLSLYGGRVATPFMILSRFQLTNTGPAQIVFDGFSSEAAFVANVEPPISRLRLTLAPVSDTPRISATAVIHFTPEEIGPYQAVLDAIRLKALDILGLGGRGYTLTNFYIDTVGKVMEISADNGKGDRPTDSKSSEEYDKTLAANMQLAGQAIGVAWALAVSKDPLLASMTAV